MKIRFADRLIGEGEPCFIIAEAGSNHNGSVEIGKKLIRAAKEVGVDAIKFQAFKTEELVTEHADKAQYQEGRSTGKSQFEMLKDLELSKEQHRELVEYAREIGIPLFYSTFDKKSADLAEELGVELFKTGSGELADLPLIEYIAKKGKPYIISTGIGDLQEVREAVEATKKTGNENIILLHCTIGYPTKKEDANLRAIDTLKKEFPNLLIGYSDHSNGLDVSLVAKKIGACVIEKHFTLDKKMPGPDHYMSMDVAEFRELIKKIRAIEKGEEIEVKDYELILGSSGKKPTVKEQEEKIWVRKSIVARIPVPMGTEITEEMLAVKRPGTGILPKHLWNIIGKKAKQNISKDEQIKWESIE